MFTKSAKCANEYLKLKETYSSISLLDSFVTIYKNNILALNYIQIYKKKIIDLKKKFINDKITKVS